MKIDQDKIHKLSLSENLVNKLQAIAQLESNFEFLPDQSVAWDDLHRLTNDEDSDVRCDAASALSSAFSFVPDKSAAWADLHRLTNDKDSDVRRWAASALSSVFSSVPDKSAAWADLIRLTIDTDSYVRWRAASALGSAFSLVPDKSAAWADLIRLTRDKDLDVRWKAADALGSAFSSVPDKSAAWADLIRLTIDTDSYVRRRAGDAIVSVFSSVPDKSAVWADLIRLTRDKHLDLRQKAVDAIVSVFSSVPDKSAAWADLIRLTIDTDSYVRRRAASALGSAFSLVPDKSTVWTDLIRLTIDTDSYVRREAADALRSAFSFVPDKSTAWADLHRLTSDDDSYVRNRAVYALGSAFSFVPDKFAAWADLHRLTSDDDSYVRMGAASALGSAFSFVRDKSAVWADLIRLTSDEDSYVRMHANHSLGKICIYKASKSEKENYSRALLEDAINYFERATEEITQFNPAKFCSLFYRSFDAVLFKKVHSKKEIEGYITAAKREIRGSKSKQKLVEAVVQLAEVLETAHSAREDGIESQELLRHCSVICNQVDKLMDENKEKTPDIHDLYKKAKPSFDKAIKELIDEVKVKAKAACREAKGTPAEPIARSVNKEIQEWRVENQVQMAKSIDNLLFSLKRQVPNIPENKDIFDKIDEINNSKVVEDQIATLAMLIPLIPTMNIPKKLDSIEAKVDSMHFDVEQLIASIKEHPNPQKYLDRIQLNLEAINDTLQNNNENSELKAMVKEALDRSSEILNTEQKLKITIPLIPKLVTYEAETNVPEFIADRIDELNKLLSKFKK